MPEEPKSILNSYDEVSRFIAELIGVDAWDGESDYYPFSLTDSTKGFLEIVYPVVGASGRLLRGAAGNGPIFIFLYCRGAWTYLGEMYGTKVTATTDNTTEFTVYAHVSATTGVERRYQFSDGAYVCVSEADVVEE